MWSWWPTRLATSEGPADFRGRDPGFPITPKTHGGSEPETAETEPGRRVRCAACGRSVARLDQAIEIQGAHLHQCVNPHGLRFSVVCFRHAPGCAAIGEATPAWTWFRGYAWQIASCRACGSHLGWRYGAPDRDGFFGLIFDRLSYSPD